MDVCDVYMCAFMSLLCLSCVEVLSIRVSDVCFGLEKLLMMCVSV